MKSENINDKLLIEIQKIESEQNLKDFLVNVLEKENMDLNMNMHNYKESYRKLLEKAIEGKNDN